MGNQRTLDICIPAALFHNNPASISGKTTRLIVLCWEWSTGLLEKKMKMKSQKQDLTDLRDTFPQNSIQNPVRSVYQCLHVIIKSLYIVSILMIQIFSGCNGNVMIRASQNLILTADTIFHKD